MSNEENGKNLPVMGFRVKDVKVTLWENKFKVGDKDVVGRSFQVSRIYKDQDDKWGSTFSFGVGDMDKLIFSLEELKRRLFVVNDDKHKEE